MLRGGKVSAAKAKQLDWARRLNMVGMSGGLVGGPQGLGSGRGLKAADGELKLLFSTRLAATTCRLCVSQALDAAKGMHYLHEHSPPIIHR